MCIERRFAGRLWRWCDNVPLPCSTILSALVILFGAPETISLEENQEAYLSDLKQQRRSW
jgi:hypothetical protein